MGKHFTHETGELGFRFRGDCGIIHGAATSLSCLFFASRYSTEKRRAVAALFAAVSGLPLGGSQKMGKLQPRRRLIFEGQNAILQHNFPIQGRIA
jgi:hypothetical protein